VLRDALDVMGSQEPRLVVFGIGKLFLNLPHVVLCREVELITGRDVVIQQLVFILDCTKLLLTIVVLPIAVLILCRKE